MTTDFLTAFVALPMAARKAERDRISDERRRHEQAMPRHYNAWRLCTQHGYQRECEELVDLTEQMAAAGILSGRWDDEIAKGRAPGISPADIASDTMAAQALRIRRAEIGWEGAQ